AGRHLLDLAGRQVKGSVEGNVVAHPRVCARPRYSSATLPTLITFAHFSVSAVTSLVKSSDDPRISTPPRSSSRAWIFGSFRAALTASLSRWTISGGVFFGTPSPKKALAS